MARRQFDKKKLPEQMIDFSNGNIPQTSQVFYEKQLIYKKSCLKPGINSRN